MPKIMRVVCQLSVDKDAARMIRFTFLGHPICDFNFTSYTTSSSVGLHCIHWCDDTSGLTGSSMPTTAMQTSCDTTSSSLSQSGSCVTTTSPGCVTAVPAETCVSSLIPSRDHYWCSLIVNTSTKINARNSKFSIHIQLTTVQCRFRYFNLAHTLPGATLNEMIQAGHDWPGVMR